MSLHSGDEIPAETPLAMGPALTVQGPPPLKAMLLYIKVPDLSSSALSDRRYS